MNFKIVVADDEQAIASAIAYALRREGYTVETAAVGVEALSKTDSFRPACVGVGRHDAEDERLRRMPQAGASQRSRHSFAYGQERHCGQARRTRIGC